jgi:hypothetical protein
VNEIERPRRQRIKLHRMDQRDVLQTGSVFRGFSQHRQGHVNSCHLLGSMREWDKQPANPAAIIQCVGWPEIRLNAPNHFKGVRYFLLAEREKTFERLLI